MDENSRPLSRCSCERIAANAPVGRHWLVIYGLFSMWIYYLTLNWRYYKVMDEDDYWEFIKSDCRYPMFSDEDTSFDESDYHYPICEE